MRRYTIPEFNYWPHLATVVIVCIALIAYRYFAYYDTRSSDSYVSANVINVAPLVSGPISKIYIGDNQNVTKGQKLLEIDPRPYEYAMQKAKAALNIANLNYKNDKFAITVAEQKYKQSLVLLSLNNDYLTRYKTLQRQGNISLMQLMNSEAKMHEQAAAVIEAAQELKIAEQNLDDNNILAAKAAYSETRYLYDHTTILAPEDGYVTNMNVRRGQYIKTGEGLFALVETKHWWVVTRYRETAIRLIKPGDKAKITLDMYPGKTFHGHVKSIGWGINRVQSGDVVQSTLAYLEATEDWIKIAQRFPVRIFFDDLSPEYPLRIGASAVTTTYR